LDTAFEARLKLLSTTHFGMAAPVMNLTRERTARRLVEEAMENAGAAFTLAAGQPAPGSFSLLDYPRGESTGLVEYPAHPSRGLMRLPLRAGAPADLVVKDQDGQPIPCALLDNELLFVAELAAGERQQYHIETSKSSPRPEMPVQVMKEFIQNKYLRLEFDERGQASRLRLNGREINAGPLLHSGVTYAGRTYRVPEWRETESIAGGVVGLKRQQGVLRLPGGYPVRFERELLLAAGLPYLYLRMRVRYPRTPDQGYDPGKAQRLQQAWDNRWQEALPCEIHPKLTASPRVWKHNYCDHISHFELDYGRFSKNHNLANVNNQITAGWLAVTDGQKGLLLAQSADSASNVAFCPLRVHSGQLRMNPFGTYWGRQYHYATADTGLGKLLATTFSAADQIKPYAPSYNGRVQEFSLLLAPFTGDRPPETLQHDAEAFAYPYILLNDETFLAPPAHRSWDGSGLGEAPDK